MKEHCCEMMAFHCRETEAQVTYLPRFHEYGLPCADGSSHIVIRYCPWCGKALQPWDLRDRWFAELEAKGFDDPLLDPDIPEAYKSERWWAEEPDAAAEM